MSIQIAICDDSSEDIGRLSEALYSYDRTFKITEYQNGEFLVADCLEKENLYDILFLDIYMPGINGIETAAKIRAAMKDVIIIFVSSSNEHYPEAFDVFAFNYIIKPINKDRISTLMNQALKNIVKEHENQISFSYKATNYRIFCKDIMYLESKDKIIIFHMMDKTTLQCYGKLDQIGKQLPGDSFIRCHQSFIVNIYHIDEMADSHFRVGSAVINVSKKYHKEAKDKYFDYLFHHMNHKNSKYPN